MSQSAEAGGILALQVARAAQQFRIVVVGLLEELPVQLQVLPGILPQPLDRKENAQAMPADGDVGQQCVRVFTGLAAKLFQLTLFDVVDVCQAQAGPTVDVCLLLATRETHGHGEAGTGELLTAGGGVVALRPEIAVFFGMIPHGL